MANCNDLTDKMKKLVVEEKTNEKNWNDLPFEMKEMVVKEMNIETRARLKMCSKSDKYLVESVPIPYVHAFFFISQGHSHSEKFSVRVELFKKYNMRCWSLFRICSVYNDKVTIRSNWNSSAEDTMIPCSSIEEGETVVKQVIASVLSTGKLRFDSVRVEHWNQTSLLINSEFTIHAKQMFIVGDPREMTGWLNAMAPGVESVYLELRTTVHNRNIEGVGAIPAVMNASKLKIYLPSDINDEQLLNFKCTRMEHLNYSNISSKGLNQLIKKAIDNNYPIGTRYNINTDRCMKNLSDTWKEISEGLNIEITHFIDEKFDIICYEFKTGVIRMGQDKQMNICIYYDETEQWEMSLCNCKFFMSIKSS